MRVAYFVLVEDCLYENARRVASRVCIRLDSNVLAVPTTLASVDGGLFLALVLISRG